jgi:hypothetical protein
LRVSDDFLRAYYLRPELRPLTQSCDAERALHAALLRGPRRAVRDAEIEALADADARDNYRVVLAFRERLLAAGTLEACYAGLFRDARVAVPPLFVDQLAHVILRSVLEGRDDPLEARAGELFFREQKATRREGQGLLADRETVELHASGTRYGGIGRLIVEARADLAQVDLEVLDRANAARYWERESRHDTVISLDFGRPALDALARVIEAWVAHFFAVAVAVRPVRAIDGPRWGWHIGLDAESTAILNALWRGEDIEAGRLQRIQALFRMTFDDASLARPEALAGVVLALSADGEDVVRMKPQNLLSNLPLAVRS